MKKSNATASPGLYQAEQPSYCIRRSGATDEITDVETKGENECRFSFFPWRRSAILLADGMKNIQGLDRLVQDNHLVLDISGNAVHVPLLERLLFRADEEGRPARKDHAHL